MSSARSCSWIVFALLTASSAALAQDQNAASSAALDQDQNADLTSADSRTAVLTAERIMKAGELTPPDRTKVEKALFRYDNSVGGLAFIFESWHGFQLASGGFPAGAGTNFGVRYTRDLGRVRPALDPDRANRVELDTLGAYSTHHYFRGSAAIDIHHLGGGPFDLRFGGQHYEYPEEDFFGFGQDSLKNNRTDYLLRSTEAGTELKWTPRLFDVAGGVAYLDPTIGSGHDSRFPSTDEVFDPATIPGYQRQPTYIRSQGSAAFDWRDNPLHPHAGGRYGVQFSDYHDRDLDAFGFRKVTVDLQEYVPIPDRYRTIALHAAAVFTDPHSGQDVPFYFQPSLGGARTLRGFREFRFQDRNSVALSAEYRWEAWWALDGAVFVDAGQVAFHRQDLKLSDFDVSYGFGFRFHRNAAFVGRLDLAFSREGFIPLLRFEHVF